MDGGSDSGSPTVQAGSLLRQNMDLCIDIDSIFYTPLEAPRRCCGGLSTLRGTPPQHLFDVDLLWNDLAGFKFFFMASVACVAFSVSAGGSCSPLGAKIVHFGSLGGPWHPEKTSPEKELKKGSFSSYAVAHSGAKFRSIFQ